MSSCCFDNGGARWRATSAAALSTARVRAETSCPNRQDHEIVSGYPWGCASGDHSRKFLLRTNRSASFFFRYAAIRYGPVAGTGCVPTSRERVPSGTAKANGSASLVRKSGSGFVRWKVIVRATRFVTIPLERSHLFSETH